MVVVVRVDDVDEVEVELAVDDDDDDDVVLLVVVEEDEDDVVFVLVDREAGSSFREANVYQPNINK